MVEVEKVPRGFYVIIKDPDTYLKFKKMVVEKNKTPMMFSVEVERAMYNYLIDWENYNNASEKNYRENEHLGHVFDGHTERISKRERLQNELDKNISYGMSIDERRLIDMIASCGYGHTYAKKQVAPNVIKSYNLDVTKQGMEKVWLPHLERFEEFPTEIAEKYNKEGFETFYK